MARERHGPGPARAPALVWLAVVVGPWLVLACGPSAARRAGDGPTPDQAPGDATRLDQASPGTVVTLYRDRASVTDRGQAEPTQVPITWHVRYTLILEPGTADEGADALIAGSLDAVLELTNQGEADLPRARYLIADQPWPGTSGETSAWARVPGDMALGAGETRVVTLGLAGMRVHVARRLLYDPIASGSVHRDATPVVDRAHGVQHVDIARPALYHALAMDLAAARIGPLPAGEIAVFQRAPDNELRFLGGHDDFGAGPGATRADIRLGVVAQGVEVERQQADFARDLVGRRVVEEIRVVFHNHSGREQRVIVREQLYRGSNWSIVYHNEVGAPRKVGPQTIRFEVRLASPGSTRIVYRVAYTWNKP